jgi:hypothetical protein
MTTSNNEGFHGIPERTPRRIRSTADAPGTARTAPRVPRETFFRSLPVAYRQDRVPRRPDPAALGGAPAALHRSRAARGKRFAPGHGEGALLNETIIARLTNDGEAKLIRSLLETYGIPSTLTYDVPNLVYPNNVGEIRIAVPVSMEAEALGILAAHREGIAPEESAAPAEPPASSPHLVLLATPRLDDDEEEEEDDDEEWDDEDDDDGDEGDEGDGDEDDLDDDDLFDDEE